MLSSKEFVSNFLKLNWDLSRLMHLPLAVTQCPGVAVLNLTVYNYLYTVQCLDWFWLEF